MDKHGMVQFGVTPSEDGEKKADHQDQTSESGLQSLADNPTTRISDATKRAIPSNSGTCGNCKCGGCDNKD